MMMMMMMMQNDTPGVVGSVIMRVPLAMRCRKTVINMLTFAWFISLVFSGGNLHSLTLSKKHYFLYIFQYIFEEFGVAMSKSAASAASLEGLQAENLNFLDK